MPSLVEQPKVVVDIVHVLEGGVAVGEPSQLPLAEVEHVELVFEDDAAVVEAVHDDEVAGFYLFVGEGDLCQVVFALVGVVLRAVGDLLERVFHLGGTRQRVAHLVGELFGSHRAGNDGLVGTPPVVDVLTLSPQSLESLLALGDGRRIVEIPRSLLRLLRGSGRPTVVLLTSSATVLLFLHLLLGLSLLLAALLLFLFLDEFLDDAVDGSIALGLGGLGQPLE